MATFKLVNSRQTLYLTRLNRRGQRRMSQALHSWATAIRWLRLSLIPPRIYVEYLLHTQLTTQDNREHLHQTRDADPGPIQSCTRARKHACHLYYFLGHETTVCLPRM
jgi:hypothetical protein